MKAGWLGKGRWERKPAWEERSPAVQFWKMTVWKLKAWLKCLHVLSLVAQLSPTLFHPMDCSPPGSSVHGDSPGKNTGVGCHALLQGIFPTQGWNSGIPHWRWVLYQLSNQGKPYVLTYPLEIQCIPLGLSTPQFEGHWARPESISVFFEVVTFQSWDVPSILKIPFGMVCFFCKNRSHDWYWFSLL